MRGDIDRQVMMTATTPEQLVPSDHPIRQIKPIVDRALASLSPVFEDIYSRVGRPSIPPEHLLKAQLLMALFSVPSARRFCDQLQYNMLFKWFLDLNIDDRPFHASTFSKNQERFLSTKVARLFLNEIVEEARRQDLISSDHFSVDGTLLDAWASVKSFRPKDSDNNEPPGSGRDPIIDFRGERRSNDTHVSATDPEAKLKRKSSGDAARLCYAGHVLIEHRNGLVVDVDLTQSVGVTEWEAALGMLDRLPGKHRKTVAGDRAYDNRGFVAACRQRRITPRVAQFPTTRRRRSAIDGRTTRHAGYRDSQRWRKRAEQFFGWVKTVGGGWKLLYVGEARNRMWAEIRASAYNLVRMARLAPA